MQICVEFELNHMLQQVQQPRLFFVVLIFVTSLVLPFKKRKILSLLV